MNKIIAFLREENPDIIALQESYNERDKSLPSKYRTVSVLKKSLSIPYTSFAPAFRIKEDNGFQTIQGNAVLSKLPMLSEESIFYDKPFRDVRAWDSKDYAFYPRLLQHVILNAGRKKLHVYNTHGIWDTHGKDNPRRLHMSEMIREAVKDKAPAVLSGDFNVNEGTTSIQNIASVMQDVFANELLTSFNMEIKPKDSGFAHAVVDHIFISRDITLIKHYMPSVNISDHMPLVAIFEI